MKKLLLGPSIHSQSPEEFYNYIVSLRNEDFKVKRSKNVRAVGPVSISKNKKGNLIIRIKRKPKRITKKEIELLSKKLDITQVELWNACKKRKIEIVDNIENTVSKKLSLTADTIPW